MRNFLIGLAIAVISGGSLIFLANFKDAERAEPTNNDAPLNDTLSDDVTDSDSVDQQMASVASQNYLDFNEENFDSALGTDRVLFFHASWCPTCHELDKNLLSEDIPKYLTILKVDYDSSFDLKRKYGVTYQHTLVHVDKNGDLINSWYGSYTVDEIIANL